MRNTKMTTMAGISLAALLAVTACGDDADADQNGEDTAAESSNDTFDFGDADASGEEIRIELPADLADTEDRVLDAAVVRAGEHADSDCAIEVSYEYADGIEAKLSDHEWSQGIQYAHDPHDLAPMENRIAKVFRLDTDSDNDAIMHGEGVEYLADDLQSATFPVECGSGTVEIPFPAITEWIEPETEEIPDHGGTDIYHPGSVSFSTLATVEVGLTGDTEVSVLSSETD